MNKWGMKHRLSSILSDFHDQMEFQYFLQNKFDGNKCSSFNVCFVLISTPVYPCNALVFAVNGKLDDDIGGVL